MNDHLKQRRLTLGGMSRSSMRTLSNRPEGESLAGVWCRSRFTRHATSRHATTRYATSRYAT